MEKTSESESTMKTFEQYAVKCPAPSAGVIVVAIWDNYGEEGRIEVRAEVVRADLCAKTHNICKQINRNSFAGNNYLDQLAKLKTMGIDVIERVTVP